MAIKARVRENSFATLNDDIDSNSNEAARVALINQKRSQLVWPTPQRKAARERRTGEGRAEERAGQVYSAVKCKRVGMCQIYKRNLLNEPQIEAQLYSLLEMRFGAVLQMRWLHG